MKRPRPGFTLLELLVVAALVLLFLWIMSGGRGLPEIGALLVGWAVYVTETLPRVTVNWPSLLSALFWVALFTAGAHRFCRWLYREAGVRASPAGPPRRWRVRWTVTGVLVVMLMFAAGTAAVAVAHQVGFLATSDQPMYAYHNHLARTDAADLKRYCTGLQDYAQRMGGLTAANVREWAEEYELEPGQFDAVLHLVAVDRPDGRVAAVVLFHRDPAERERHGIAIADADGVREARYEDLPGILASLPREPLGHPPPRSTIPSAIPTTAEQHQ
jgi:prepilin-type N-terminal cleavage/methylation domain-containing protein